jgi:tetratricopeptide (TPR) repeat protein
MTTADSSEANVWLSLALIDQGHFQEAISILNGVLEATQSSNALAYTSRGWANLALGREDAATHDLKIALFLGDVRAQYYLGQLALTNGDVGTAISLYRQSLPAPRSLLQVNLRYDFLFYRQGGIYESNLLPLAALPPAVPVAETYLELADLYADQGEIEAAREICQQLLALSSDYQPARDKLRALSR